MLANWFLNISQLAAQGEVRFRDEYWGPRLSKSLPSPNKLTVVRLLGAVGLVTFNFTLPWLVTVATLLFLTDYFDGIIARTQGRETTLGKWLDPIADKMLAVAVLWNIYYSDPSLWLPLAVAMLIPEVALAIVGLALVFLNAPLTPRPCVWGRLKFSLYAVAFVLYLVSSRAPVGPVIYVGVAFAWLSILYYLVRGFYEKRLET